MKNETVVFTVAFEGISTRNWKKNYYTVHQCVSVYVYTCWLVCINIGVYTCWLVCINIGVYTCWLVCINIGVYTCWLVCINIGVQGFIYWGVRGEASPPKPSNFPPKSFYN